MLDHPLSLRSVPGRGSVFSVEVPLVSALPAGGDAAEAEPAPAAPLDGLVVLAIDNEKQITEGMQLLLGGWGCTVYTAPGLNQAQEVLRREGVRPDVIIADYHLDEGDGIEAIVALRWKLARELPAVLLTADRSPSVRAEAAAKDIHVLHKPLKPAALRALLTRWRTLRIAAE